MAYKHLNAEVRDSAGFQTVDPRKWLEHCKNDWWTDKESHPNGDQATVITGEYIIKWEQTT